jgi:hypothetical protein
MYSWCALHSAWDWKKLKIAPFKINLNLCIIEKNNKEKKEKDSEG